MENIRNTYYNEEDKTKNDFVIYKIRMMNMIYRQIEAEWECLSKTERKIAKLILKDPEKFINYSAIEVSEIAEVSQGSLNNFSKKFVESGFSELKKQLAMDLNEYLSETLIYETEKDSVKSVMADVKVQVEKAFLMTEEMNDEIVLSKVAEILIKAKKIEIYGIYQSGIVAQSFYYQLLQMGLPATCVNDPLVCAVSASMLDSDSLVIAISASGKTKDIYEAIKIAKENHVPCVCITRNKTAPIARLCDEVLVIAIGEEKIERSLGMVRQCEYFLIDALCFYLNRYIKREDKEKSLRLFDYLNAHEIEEWA